MKIISQCLEHSDDQYEKQSNMWQIQDSGIIYHTSEVWDWADEGGVLITLLCHEQTPWSRQHFRGKCFWEDCLQLQKVRTFSSLQEEWKQVGKHGAGEGTENYIPIHRQTESKTKFYLFLTHYFYWHTFFKKDTPTQSAQPLLTIQYMGTKHSNDIILIHTSII